MREVILILWIEMVNLPFSMLSVKRVGLISSYWLSVVQILTLPMVLGVIVRYMVHILISMK
ncbi:hypothetical protein AAW02_08165 [Aeromonas dhakensis]|nr:hypothetical protein AAW02_08165 [Aeromonas dhakensis]PHS89835.1 hypothetical protein AAW03_02180 [Aeromonas dhakensis]TNI20289.1 hypothetical protein CF132_11960 [Aeromonas dhakensis]